ncbi:unnamed protein product [Caenorhabditis nigoni]
MRAIEVVSSATIALENRLRTHPAQYPFTTSRVKIIAVPEGRKELPFNILYHDIIPRRVIVCLLKPETSIKEDSLYFDHYNTSEVQLDVAGTMYPPQPIHSMLPGTKKPIALPDDYSPPEPGCVDINLASYMVQRYGSVNNLSIADIRNMNLHLLDLNIITIWNGCSGLHVDLISELSLDATPRNHSFVNFVARFGQQARRHYIAVLKYFEDKYNITLNYPHSPLLRDNAGRMYPIESIWLRIRYY